MLVGSLEGSKRKPIPYPMKETRSWGNVFFTCRGSSWRSKYFKDSVTRRRCCGPYALLRLWSDIVCEADCMVP